MNKQRGSTSGPTADAPQEAGFPQGKGASGDVLPNLNDLLAVRRKGAKEKSPPKEKSLRKASPRARTKERSESSVSREASHWRRYPSGALFHF